MGKSSKRYETEFKKNIVKLYESGESISQICTKYNVTKVSVYNWTKLYSKNTKSNDDSEEQFCKDNFIKLQKEIKSLKEDNEILKKGYDRICNEVSLDNKHEFINMHKKIFSVRKMTKLLNISRSTKHRRDLGLVPESKIPKAKILNIMFQIWSESYKN